MTILVTGASGHLGRHVVDSLLSRGVAASDIVAGVRTPSKAAPLADLGVQLATLDYLDAESVANALDGVDTVLLISGSDVGQRFAGHRNVIDAAEKAGVTKFVYTSAPKATTFDYALGAEHRATEEALAASTLPVIVLRNNWYTENYTQDVLGAAESGVIAAAVGDAKVASASRKDYADAAAVVLTEDGHIGRTYELAGDTSWTYAELAATASAIVGREVTYTALTPEQRQQALEGFGLPAEIAGFVTGIDTAIAGGVLEDTDGTLSALIGRPTTPLAEGLSADVEAARVSD
ncbi:SDR family oxidoreductase [Microbacterium thalassium]|uniref:NAD(P)H dehydrogenase (Quinone) n=1 Tax=Microbacterium thalassium TaxID=362649 RepID=A0A7X0FS27_9MICO|nr:SDR family oxidoreductase [Microbacterium thalassium]MBB6392683.1 NAD(P)H dehydrogenase (quinone) [Microbacterium thalassium]GLK23086.1 NAD(P)-dependent oxidoreductase [Microbacterium thalassium]